MAHFTPFMQANFSAQNQRGETGSRHNVGQDFDDDDEDDDSLSSQFNSRDKIRRNYIAAPNNSAETSGNTLNHPGNSSSHSNQRNYPIPETIQIKLNESYFANERKAAVNLLANCRQKLNSLQMFNPAKNQSIREQQEKNWNENVSKIGKFYKFKEI